MTNNISVCLNRGAGAPCKSTEKAVAWHRVILRAIRRNLFAGIRHGHELSMLR